MNFEEQVNAILGNSTQQASQRTSNFSPVRVGSKNQFLGRILPMEENQFPFVQYEQVWITYTGNSGEPQDIPVIINRQDPNDKLASKINDVFFYNLNYKRNNNTNEDVIHLNGSSFGLNIQRRASFLGVEVGKNNQGQYVQDTDATSGQQNIHSYDISFGMLRQILSQLQPEIPYMINGKPAFNTDEQFINKGATFPVSLTTKQEGGRWNTHAQVVTQVVLPPMSFNYLEKDDEGNYKYVDDIAHELRPLKDSNPSFYEKVYNQINDSINQQMSALGITSLSTNNNQQPKQAQQAFNNVPDATPSVPHENVVQPQPQVQPQAQTQVQPQPSVENVAPSTNNVAPSQPVMFDSNNTVEPDLPFDNSNLESSQDLNDFLANL